MSGAGEHAQRERCVGGGLRVSNAREKGGAAPWQSETVAEGLPLAPKEGVADIAKHNQMKTTSHKGTGFYAASLCSGIMHSERLTSLLTDTQKAHSRSSRWECGVGRNERVERRRVATCRLLAPLS